MTKDEELILSDCLVGGALKQLTLNVPWKLLDWKYHLHYLKASAQPARRIAGEDGIPSLACQGLLSCLVCLIHAQASLFSFLMCRPVRVVTSHLPEGSDYS